MGTTLDGAATDSPTTATNTKPIIDITNLDKAEVLAALYNASKQQGMGFFNPTGAQEMTVEQAREEHPESRYFDYLHGRVMKVDLTEDNFDPRLYDRDNGQGAAELALQPLLLAARSR